jgi:hypothetical protein
MTNRIVTGMGNASIKAAMLKTIAADAAGIRVSGNRNVSRAEGAQC